MKKKIIIMSSVILLPLLNKNLVYAKESVCVKEVQGLVLGSESKDYYTKAIAIYKIGVIEAPYVHNVVGYLSEGSIYEFEYKEVNEINYSTQVALNAGKIYKASLGVEARIYAIKALGNYENDTQLEISNKVTTSTTKKSESYYHVTIPITESGYYFDDLRATYNLYQVQEFEITNTRYETSRKRSGWAWDVYYGVKQSITCTNISYICEYITSCGRCLVKYDLNSDGTFTYAGPKSNESIMYI